MLDDRVQIRPERTLLRGAYLRQKAQASSSPRPRYGMALTRGITGLIWTPSWSPSDDSACDEPDAPRTEVTLPIWRAVPGSGVLQGPRSRGMPCRRLRLATLPTSIVPALRIQPADLLHQQAHAEKRFRYRFFKGGARESFCLLSGGQKDLVLTNLGPSHPSVVGEGSSPLSIHPDSEDSPCRHKSK